MFDASIVTHNLMATGTYNKLKVVTDKKKNSIEKLSSGYRINKAADDAAGLTISEGMRSLINGLNQGTKNAQDGISWVQIGDGALEEVHDMMHRMKQLTIKSLNDTNTEADRAAIQAEFNQLQSEIDRVTNTTEFNTLNIFDEHEATYYQYVGNKEWPQDKLHNIMPAPENSLTINYQKTPADPEETFTISVPAGTYTTQELIDEIDMAMENSGYEEKGFRMEFTPLGTCNVSFEDGAIINDVTGPLQYLLHDMSNGGDLGSLIGTTVFSSDTSKLRVTSENNNMTFTIQDENGVETSKSITLATGSYTKSEMIDILNGALAGTTVKAESYGKSIKLSSTDHIITKFKGNMFKIETAQPVYTSVFYDNIKYADITLSAGTYTGGAVLNTDARDTEHLKYKINSSNNTLIFQPNETTSPTVITIPDGEYTAHEMALKLTELFTSSGLNSELSITDYSSGSFTGLKITSNLVNTTSKVGLTGGSAINTLFKTRDYNTFSTVTPSNASGASHASVTAPASINKAGFYPHTITAGVNDTFLLNANYTTYEIKLSAGTYSSPQSLVDEINAQLTSSSANTAYKDKVTCSLYSPGDRIQFTTNYGTNLYYVALAAKSGNAGYNELFRSAVESSITASNSGTSTRPATITLNTPVAGDPVTITNPNFTVKLDGAERIITLPTGSVSKADILTAINNALKPVTSQNSFTPINATGSTHSFASTDVAGKTTYTNRTLTGKGTTTAIQGQTDSSDTWAVTGTTAKAVPASMTINSGNNTLSLTINGQVKDITIADGTYSKTTLLSAIQSGINDAFGTGFGSATAAYDGSGCLYFSAVPGSNGDGYLSSISASTTTSSLLKDIDKTATPGTAESGRNLASSIVLDSSNNTFTFDLNGTQKSITLSPGTYSQSSLISQINSKLSAASIPVQASIKNSNLLLTTRDSGTGNTVHFVSTGANDAFSTAVFNKYKEPATGTLNSNLQSSITIDDSSNTFIVNGKTITLANGTYTPTTFTSMLNSALAAQGAGVKAELSSGKLKLTTELKGALASLNVNYAGGGTAMSKMFGESTSRGAVASFDGSGALTITTTSNGGSLSVESKKGNIFQTGTVTTYTGTPSVSTGSTRYSYIDGNNISNPVVINDTNNKLKFTYRSEGALVPVDITLDNKNYSFDELRDALQSKIDTALGSKAGELKVTVNSSGVVIKSACLGNDYTFVSGSFSGGFYDRVIGTATHRTSSLDVTVKNGNQANDTAYAIGRKDIRSKITEIKTNVNDTLSFDLNVGGTTYNIAFKLDPGQYSGPALINQIQDKMNTALENKGLSKNLIEVQIGGIDTGIVGSNDANALVFKLGDGVALPGTGRYIIDGVGGSAAFSVFYQTDGEIETAYTTGTKDLSEGVTIEPSNNTLEFTYDGNPVSISIPAGDYDKTTLVPAINAQLTASGYPLQSEFTADGNLKIYATKFGKHYIDNISGSAKSVLFYETKNAEGEDEPIIIQLSNREGDNEEIAHQRVNTCHLDINSLVVTSPKYAGRALNKLEEALNKVSETRSYFGAMQNRIEHSILNNENKAENTTAAESRIRDADMASEMVDLSKANILEQAGVAVLTQANQSIQNVLSLLS